MNDFFYGYIVGVLASYMLIKIVGKILKGMESDNVRVYHLHESPEEFDEIYLSSSSTTPSNSRESHSFDYY